MKKRTSPLSSRTQRSGVEGSVLLFIPPIRYLRSTQRLSQRAVGRRTDDRRWVRSARKTLQWRVFSEERAEAPEEISSVLRSTEREQSPRWEVATIEVADVGEEENTSDDR